MQLDRETFGSSLRSVKRSTFQHTGPKRCAALTIALGDNDELSERCRGTGYEPLKGVKVLESAALQGNLLVARSLGSKQYEERTRFSVKFAQPKFALERAGGQGACEQLLRRYPTGCADHRLLEFREDRDELQEGIGAGRRVV